eukprot:CAMPEP_0201509446 /NCGR_PEP_ID=MMETSP0161_2-20130828/2499_1 /ASSEMBLY_ACC=CAM_ASM_000251 /TAXON_ID=180227 /ORGANISM="Neoparamoeba aestuarina, Strain SoJaBio B1-5/56/2" /LENGTH=344 /DNA_ID=CAMNT_0047904395 /DNA_START=306 /DNA_END=1337 /DNA_ORIENTATION=+
MVRKPMDHIVSQYAQCQQPKSDGQRQARPFPKISLSNWLQLANSPNATSNELTRYCFYDPRDKQVAGLGGDVETAIRVLNETLWFGVTEYFDASLCLLVSTLRDSPACTCQPRSPFPKSDHNTNTKQVVVTEDDLALISSISTQDVILHREALKIFHTRLNRFGLGCLLPGSSKDVPSATPPQEQPKGLRIPWFLSTETLGDYAMYLAASLVSARQFPILEPHLMLSNFVQHDEAFVEWCEKEGVIIHRYTPSYQPNFEKLYETNQIDHRYITKALGGVFGRYSAADVYRKWGGTAQYLLYTDADTLWISNPSHIRKLPLQLNEILAIGPEAAQGRKDNSGVLW